MIDWKKATIKPGEGKYMRRAVKRYIEFRRLLRPPAVPGWMDLTMDMMAASIHRPIDWEALSNAPLVDLVHDVGGIHHHINRKTGELTNCFVPRCAQRTTTTTERN